MNIKKATELSRECDVLREQVRFYEYYETKENLEKRLAELKKKYEYNTCETCRNYTGNKECRSVKYEPLDRSGLQVQITTVRSCDQNKRACEDFDPTI